MNISDEAVQAAMEAFLREGVKRKGELGAQPLALLAALEAAAPYMAAQALEDAVAAFPLETIVAPDNAVVWMMRRAEELRSARG